MILVIALKIEIQNSNTSNFRKISLFLIIQSILNAKLVDIILGNIKEMKNYTKNIAVMYFNFSRELQKRKKLNEIKFDSFNDK